MAGTRGSMLVQYITLLRTVIGVAAADIASRWSGLWQHLETPRRWDDPRAGQLGDFHRAAADWPPGTAYSWSMSWTARRSTSTDPQSVWPRAELLLENLETYTDRQIVWSQTELHVHTVHVLYNWETSTDPQRVWPQTELQVQTVHALESLEVYIHKLSERFGLRQSFKFRRPMSSTTWRHPQTLRGSGPRQSFKFRRSMSWTTWRSTSTNSQSIWSLAESFQTPHDLGLISGDWLQQFRPGTGYARRQYTHVWFGSWSYGHEPWCLLLSCPRGVGCGPSDALVSLAESWPPRGTTDNRQWFVLQEQDGQQWRTTVSDLFYRNRTVSSDGQPSVICSTGTGRSAVTDNHQWFVTGTGRTGTGRSAVTDNHQWFVLQEQDGQQWRTTISDLFYRNRTVSSDGQPSVICSTGTGRSAVSRRTMQARLCMWILQYWIRTEESVFK